MGDLINRQDAIDALNGTITLTGHVNVEATMEYIRSVADRLNRLPSIQSERLTNDDFETIRIHLNAYKEKLCNQQRCEEAEEYQRIIDRFMAFASAQPEQPETIRCKDCFMHGVCRFEQWLGLDGYCSKAERRTDV